MKPWFASSFTVLAALFWNGEMTVAAEPKTVAGPLYHEATNEFTTMKLTSYQHTTRVDRVTGSYCYDCVGFVSHALKKAAPQAWTSVARETAIPPHRIPSPPKYRTFLASLSVQPKPGWEAVTNAASFCPGDVIAWEHKTATSSGHVVIVGGFPTRLQDGSWSVKVYDSTSAPHGDDSRPNDPRAQILASSGQHSGLGYGEMVFVTDETSGMLTGLRWSKKSRTITVPIAAGRPTS